MILEDGKKVLVVHRRLFETDEARYFVGIVDGYEAGVMKVTGHSWMKDPFAGAVVEKPEMRTKVLSIASGTLLTYVLPDSVELRKLRFEAIKDGGFWLSDGESFRLNLTEKGHSKAPLKAK